MGDHRRPSETTGDNGRPHSNYGFGTRQSSLQTRRTWETMGDHTQIRRPLHRRLRKMLKAPCTKPICHRSCGYLSPSVWLPSGLRYVQMDRVALYTDGHSVYFLGCAIYTDGHSVSMGVITEIAQAAFSIIFIGTLRRGNLGKCGF